MTDEREFLYYLRKTGFGFQVEIGYYDPTRFEGEGGHLFGAKSTVDVDIDRFDQTQVVRVEQTGNSFVSIETAELRGEVNRQALDLAHTIDNWIKKGETVENIVTNLKILLTPDTPTKTSFSSETFITGR